MKLKFGGNRTRFVEFAGMKSDIGVKDGLEGWLNNKFDDCSYAEK